MQLKELLIITYFAFIFVFNSPLILESRNIILQLLKRILRGKIM